MHKATCRAPSCRDLVTAIAILSLAACNTRSPIEENATSPTAPTTTVITPPGATPVSSLFSVDLTPKAIVGGGVARGVLTLSFPAPPGGAVVTLSSGDATVAVPASITVPAGAEMVEFSATAQAVPTDRQVMITAAGLGSSVSTPLSLWAAVPSSPSFWFISEPGETMGGGTARRFGADSTITAFCSASRVTVEVRNGTDRWTAQFSAPLGTPLRTGSYENAVSPSTNQANSSTTRPELGVTRTGATCSTTGRFDVHEVDLSQNGTVRAFFASFTQQCQGRPQVLSGGVRVANAPGNVGASTCYEGSSRLPTPTQPTFFRFESTIGDPLGAGESRLFEPPQTTFRGQTLDTNRMLELWMFTDSGAWTLRVAAPPGQQLRPGRYVNAPWAPTNGLFFSLSGPGRGCSTSMTDFEVLEAVYTTPPPGSSPLVTGFVERFHTTFRHRCNPTAVPLNGEISIRALLPNRCNTPSGSC
ncbi:MAG: hypothetical protein ABW292_13815 [Vicinamibacterales bacterium]